MRVFSYKKYCEWVDGLNISEVVKKARKNSWALDVDGEEVFEVKGNNGKKWYETGKVDGKVYTVSEIWLEEIKNEGKEKR